MFKSHTSKGFSAKREASGFTLIELLVAVAILAILATIGVTLLRGNSARALDSKRKADVQAIVKAYEQTYDPQSGNFDPSQAKFSNGLTTPPTPPEGGTYGGLLSAPAATFNVCADLGAGAPVVNHCSVNSATCYCLSNSQGN